MSPRPGLTCALPHNSLLSPVIVLKLVDPVFLVLDVFQKIGVLFLEVVNKAPLVLKSRQTLGTAQHNCRVSDQRYKTGED